MDTKCTGGHFGTKEEDLIIILENLIDAIKKANEIDTFVFNSIPETHDVSTGFYMKEELTGWVNFNLHIRLRNIIKNESNA